DFFRTAGAAGPCERCEGLLDRFASVDDKTLVLRLGWGTGWRTMTGDLLTREERDRVMRRVGKTRKVIVEGHSQRSRPADVLGWVQLDPVDAAEAHGLFVEPLAASPGKAVLQEPARGASTQMPSAADTFDRSVQALQPKDRGRI